MFAIWKYQAIWKSIAPGRLGERTMTAQSIPGCRVGIGPARPWVYIVII